MHRHSYGKRRHSRTRDRNVRKPDEWNKPDEWKRFQPGQQPYNKPIG